MFRSQGFLNAASGIAAMMFPVVPAAQAQSLIQNGSFESAYAFWTPSGAGSVSWIATTNAAAGNYAMAFSGQNATLTQQFVSGAGNFDYSFSAGRSEAFGPFDDVPLFFALKIDGITLASSLPQFDPNSFGRPDGTRLLSSYIGSVMLGAGTHTISFEYSRGPTLFARDPFILIDGVSLAPQAIAAVPEPSAWALLILGFGVTGGALRRSRKARVALAYA